MGKGETKDFVNDLLFKYINKDLGHWTRLHVKIQSTNKIKNTIYT